MLLYVAMPFFPMKITESTNLWLVLSCVLPIHSTSSPDLGVRNGPAPDGPGWLRDMDSHHSF